MKVISGFNKYAVDEQGIIYSCTTGKWLERKTQVCKTGRTKGRCTIDLWKDGKQYMFLISRLVLTTYVGPCPEGMEGCHNDGKPTHNWLSNLRWDTKSNNQADRLIHGTDQFGEKNASAKLTKKDVLEIRAKYLPGMSYQRLADMYAVSCGCIGLIIRRERWPHI